MISSSFTCLVVVVLFFCESGCFPFSVSTFPPVCLTADIPFRQIDFLIVRPDECSSFSGTVVSRLVTELHSGWLSVYLDTCLPQALSSDILRCVEHVSPKFACLLVWVSLRFFGAGRVEQRSHGGCWALHTTAERNLPFTRRIFSPFFSIFFILECSLLFFSLLPRNSQADV
jgi:hypothetical protein